jgi:thiol-disulfide isomerase/thioredoxin/outer membrane lipoprotein-sorting protein
VKKSALVTGLLAVSAAVMLGGGCGKQTAKEVARKVEKVYRETPALQQSSTIVMTAKLLEKQDVRSQRSRLYFKRPRCLRVETGSGTLAAKVVCDGKSLYTRAATPQSWLREPAPKNWKDSKLLRLSVQSSQELVLVMLDGETPLSKAENLSLGKRLEQVDGTKCYVLSARTGGSQQRSFSFKKEQRIWVGTRDFLIRKCSVKMQPKLGSAGGALGALLEKLQMTEVEVMKPRNRWSGGKSFFAFESSPGTQVIAYGPDSPLSSWLGGRNPMSGAQGLTGQKAPELSVQEWVKGPATSVAAMKGKVVLLDFWATWCVPCVRTVPMLQRMQSEYAERGLVVIGIHDDSSSSEEILRFMEGRGVTYRVAIDGEDGNMGRATYRRYQGPGAIPMAVLIDRGGVVRWVGHPGAQRVLRSRIEDLLSQ